MVDNMQIHLATLKRLEDGFYRDYQVDIDHGSPSLELLDVLYRAYTDALMRFSHCYVFRFRVRIPNKQRQQEGTILNQWFYRLCHYRRNDNLNVIWKREVVQSGSISYRITLFLDASNYPPIINELKVRKRLAKDIKHSWAKTTQIHKQDANELCIFLNQPLFILNKSDEDYQFQRGYLFYVLSRQAHSNTEVTNASSTLGAFISKSRSRKQNNRKRK